jgi:hypothetical protein
MIDETTRLLAAGILADKRFPNVDLLPRIAPLPYRHPGHWVLVDYRQLVLILWGAALAIRKQARQCYVAEIVATLGALAIGDATFGLVQSAAIFGVVQSTETVTSLGVALVVGALSFWIFKPKMEKRAAAVRAEHLDSLLRREQPPSDLQLAKKLGAAIWTYGDGQLDRHLIPVLFARDESRRFPGYGDLIHVHMFVCRPNDDAPNKMTRWKLTRVVEDELGRVASGLRFAEVTIGRVVVVDGRAVARDSPWLDESGRPRLDYPRADGLKKVEALDPLVSTRVYSAIEVLLPEHLTSITFFVRAFMVGSSAACELCVCILGPPRWTWRFVRERLHKHRVEQSWSQRVRAALAEVILKSGRQSSLGERMATVRKWTVQNEEPFSVPQSASALRKLDPFDPKEAKEVAEEIERLQERTSLWAGRYLAETNWREVNSSEMTGDIFGKYECHAAVKALYVGLSRAILNTLDRNGFDVTDYKDDHGRLHINAENIEQLVVGERIGSVTKNGASDAKDDGRARQSSQTKTSTP